MVIAQIPNGKKIIPTTGTSKKVIVKPTIKYPQDYVYVYKRTINPTDPPIISDIGGLFYIYEYSNIYIDTNTGSKEDYYIFPQSITQLPNNRLVFNLLAKTSRKLLIFDFSKESILRVALDCNTKSGSLYQKGDIDAASKKIVNEVFFGNPEFMPLQQIPIGTVFDHLFTQICDPARRINIVQKFEVRSPLWTVAMNLDNAKSVYLNRNFVFRVNNYADVVLKTENVIAENLPYIDKPIKTMIQRYRIDCPSQMMEIDSDFLAEDLSLLSKFTSYGTNAKQKMLPNSTGELAYSLGCK